MREGAEFNLGGYAIRIVKMNQTLPELVDLKLLPDEDNTAID
jgi:hypothetical protein